MMSAIKKIQNIIESINRHPLAGKHRIRSYARFMQWQFSQSLFPHLTKIHFIGDTYFLAQKGMTGATGNIYCGLHEFEDMSFVLHFLREEDTFADVGANIGSYTLLASGVCGASAISFEPVPATFKFLKDNIRLNGLQNKTELWNAAVGASPGKIKFTSSLDTVNHAIPKEEENTKDYIEVDVLPLSQILQNKKNLRLIKIDTEGFESEVLAGMGAVLKDENLKGIIIELNGSGERYGFDENNIRIQLRENNFTPYSYEPYTRSLTPVISFSDKNTIYLRDIDFVKHRIASSEKIKIFSESF